MVFEGEPLLLLNFEDPDDMAKKQQWLRAELVRRSQQDKRQAKSDEKPEDPLRR